MNNEPIALTIIDGIYDIQPLATPAISPLELTLLSILSLLVVIILSYYTWLSLYSTRGVAKRKLNKIHAEFSQHNIDEHDTAYQLCSVLRKGLKLNNINKNTRLPASLNRYKEEWDTFTKKTSNLRYCKNKKSRTEINTLYEDSLHWLKLWP
ncbi:MAG: hypothetical protein KAT06_11770 [Gammaproteobacteria bacterium]|nr:hypothetical protein [Gammaproteobacteria bacterium]